MWQFRADSPARAYSLWASKGFSHIVNLILGQTRVGAGNSASQPQAPGPAVASIGQCHSQESSTSMSTRTAFGTMAEHLSLRPRL
jgi:hypothetical protein